MKWLPLIMKDTRSYDPRFILGKDLLKWELKKPCHIDTVPENFVKDNQGKA